jgi:hypothetical protein
VIEVPDRTFAGLRRSLRDAHGFHLQPRHFAVSGQCADCAGAPGALPD